MKLTRVRWPHLQKDLPGEKGPLDFVTDADYDLTLVDPFVELIHRATGKRLLIERTGACLHPAPEKVPIVPVAPEASGTARTVKSSKR